MTGAPAGEPRAPELGREYRRWGADAGPTSPTYGRLAAAVAADPELLALLSAQPERCRQPNLLFGVLRWYGVDVADPAAALAWTRANADLLVADLRTRRTQTNEAARCAILLPALASLPGPLALVELGASAGLCLVPDRYRYRYDLPDGTVRRLGPARSSVELPCRVSGPVPLPHDVPTIAWRIGIDLYPVDATDPDARRWLRCLVWPEHADRAQRLDAALDLVARDPPEIVAGDVTRDLDRLLDRVPDGLTPVVTHTAVLCYLPPEQRSQVRALLTARGVRRVGAEGWTVLPDLLGQLPDPPGDQFVLALDDTVLGVAEGHGRRLAWTGPVSRDR